MKNREILQYPVKVANVLSLTMEIQNKGIGTAFFTLDAHVSIIRVQVHLQAWSFLSDGPDVEFDCCIGDKSSEEDIDEMISELNVFINSHGG